MTWLLSTLLYVSVVAFLAGMGWRLFTWLRAPVPLKIVLTPGPATTPGVVCRLGAEALLFQGVFRADRMLWAAGWAFHFSLVLLAVGHFGGLVAPGFAQASLRLSSEQFHHLAQVAGGVFGIVAMISLLWLLFRRVLAERVRYISTFGDFSGLMLLLLIIATGNQMRFMGGLDLAQARQFVAGVLMLHPVAPPLHLAFTAHVLLVCALLVYIPFSKLMHLGGLVFSPTLNQRNNPREKRYA